MIGFLLAAWTWLRRNPALALCAILALGWANDHRLHVHWRDKYVAQTKASQAAEKATKALRETERAQSKELAHEADEHHAQAVVAVRSRTDDYVAKHRVPAGGQCAAVAVDQAGVAGVRDEVSGTAVMASEADLQRAAEWQAYGVAMNAWALSVGQ